MKTSGLFNWAVLANSRTDARFSVLRVRALKTSPGTLTFAKGLLSPLVIRKVVHGGFVAVKKPPKIAPEGFVAVKIALKFAPASKEARFRNALTSSEGFVAFRKPFQIDFEGYEALSLDRAAKVQG